jgi:pyrimidine operon attenuation protein/uracil phosphoribosyltransferase
MTAEQMHSTIVRMTHQILERDHLFNEYVFVGIQTRGLPLAERLCGFAKVLGGENFEVRGLDVTLHRDDRLPGLGQSSPTASTASSGLSGRRVILVDDVLFTGRTVRAALDAIMSVERPTEVLLAVLIDRGHRELPIRPDIVGRNVPTSRDQRIRVRLAEVDDQDEVVLLSAAFAELS